MKNDLTPDEIIDELGGTSVVADECEIQPASVSGWRKTRIPKPWMKYFRATRPEVFQKLEAKKAGNSR